ncbi:MAG: hypothetical protein ACI8RZ_002612 [Myxococcota bacterium]|jgi:hypothetical protein
MIKRQDCTKANNGSNCFGASHFTRQISTSKHWDAPLPVTLIFSINSFDINDPMRHNIHVPFGYFPPSNPSTPERILLNTKFLPSVFIAATVFVSASPARANLADLFGNDPVAGDEDADGDPAETDCDDQDSTRYHGAIEICNDSIDNNCSGPEQAGTIHLQSSMGSALYEQTVFANTYVSAGAGSDEIVNGNIMANTYVSIGANSTVTGSIQNSSYLTTGDSATIDGDTMSVGATTLGASSAVYGSLQSGNAVTLGAGSQVVGTVEYGTVLTNGAGSSSGTQTQNTTTLILVDEHQGVIDAQTALDAMTGGTVLIPGNIAVDTTFTAGIYDVAGLLTVTANTIITLDAQNQDSEFIFNISGYLTFGAGVDVVVINGTDNTRVIWNSTGGYVSTGAGANIIGTVLAKDYVVTGADSTLSGAGDSCGAVYSATSYVSIGAGSEIGTEE